MNIGDKTAYIFIIRSEDSLEYRGKDGRIILKCVLKKEDISV
jgi:hypothetical protein